MPEPKKDSESEISLSDSSDGEVEKKEVKKVAPKAVAKPVAGKRDKPETEKNEEVVAEAEEKEVLNKMI